MVKFMKRGELFIRHAFHDFKVSSSRVYLHAMHKRLHGKIHEKSELFVYHRCVTACNLQGHGFLQDHQHMSSELHTSLRCCWKKWL